MKSPPSNLPAVLIGAAFLMMPAAFANPLDAYLGRNRMILVSLPHGPTSEKVTAALLTQRKQIEERDLKIADISEEEHRIPTALRLPSKQTVVIRKQFGIGKGETRPVFILIGKDGGEKARCHGALNLEKWFALIDEMPMRRAEIQDQRKTK